MKKLLSIQRNWFVGNDYRAHLVPDNSVLVIAETEIMGTKIEGTIWYEYHYDYQSGTRRGVLFVKDKTHYTAFQNNIGCHPYLAKSFSHHGCDIINVQAHYTGFNDSNIGVQSTIKMGNILWSIIGAEQLIDDAVLLTLKQLMPR